MGFLSFETNKEGGRERGIWAWFLDEEEKE